MSEVQTLFEQSVPTKRAWSIPPSSVPTHNVANELPAGMTRKSQLGFPELSEIDIVRHYTNLSLRNHGVDTGFYPLGSCTMKYNPKINEDITNLPNFQDIHPFSPAPCVQGNLALIAELQLKLCEITGMDAFTLQPAAGAHGELTALLITREYFRVKGESGRTKILVPTSAHGTNPASASMAGFETVPVNCTADGLVDLEHLKQLLSPEVAALMLTNPNTLGLFERDIAKIAALVHEAGGLLYYDGANMNAIMGLVRPGDMGFDLIHLNLHKTFATPHGGGGPGSGPVGVKNFLTDYLPAPVLAKNPQGYYWDENRPNSIGKVQGFFGNFLVLVKALAYIKAMGGTGLAQASRDAVLNANYLLSRLNSLYTVPYNRFCMHEFVISAANLPHHIRALDIAKRLIDFGYHPPTIYFPLNVPEALMIEPTETEGKDTLDEFVECLTQIHQEIDQNHEILISAPNHSPINRVDETQAARNPKLRWQPANLK